MLRFKFDLAEHLHRTVTELGSMPYWELAYWMARHEADGGWGEKRADTRNAITAYTVAHSGFAKPNKPLPFETFMPAVGKAKEERPLDWGRLKADINSMVKALSSGHVKPRRR